MQQTTILLQEMKLVGVTARTNNAAEMHWETGKFPPTVRQYFHQLSAQSILHRKKIDTILCVYTEYESDHTGDYTYFIGEEVTTFEGQPSAMEQLTIPAQTYTKFTNGPAPMPDVVKEPWIKIWKMTPEELGGVREYIADFEVYDERAVDHGNVVLDVYIGVKGK